jgi:3-mercaptopyruvate sulfurtransferase SseA
MGRQRISVFDGGWKEYADQPSPAITERAPPSALENLSL